MAIGKIMCFGNAQKEDPDAKKNREIEKQLREDQRRMQKEVKLLLLGASPMFGAMEEQEVDFADGNNIVRGISDRNLR